MKQKWWLAGLLLALVLVGNVVATYNTLTKPYPGHNDFMSRWEGARAFWRDGLNPYSDEASLMIQERIYGRAAKSDEDPGYFAYPLYTAFLIAPLTYTSYAWASAIWMVLLEVSLVGTLFLLLDLYGWRPGPMLLAFFMLWTLAYYYAARGLILGQPGHLVYALQALALWALAKRYDSLAGGALALSTIKPQMGFLIVPFLLLWALRVRRWHVVRTFLLLWGGLMLASFIAQPSWLRDWLEQVRRYPSYTDIGAPAWIVMQYYLGTGTVGEWTVNLALYALLLWAWWAVLIPPHPERLAWTVMLTLTITHLSAVRTATPHFVIFTIPLMFYFARFFRFRQGRRWVVLILLALLVLPWLQFFLTVDGKFEHPSMYLPLPFGMLVLLWLTRKQWWGSLSQLQ